MTSHQIGFLLACVATVAGLLAAHYWLRASRVSIICLSVSPSDSPEQHILGTQVAYNESSRLNAVAARWTAGATALGGAATLLGYF